MPDIKLNIGATVDVASSKELHDAVTGLQGHIERKLSPRINKPIRRSIRSAGGVQVMFDSSSTNFTLIGFQNPDTPSVGKVWAVRSGFVYDNTNNPVASSNSGVNMALCIGNPSSPSPVHMTGWTWTGLPAANTFNPTSLTVQPNESIYVIINGNVAANNIGFNFVVDEWNDDDFQAQRLG